MQNRIFIRLIHDIFHKILKGDKNEEDNNGTIYGWSNGCDHIWYVVCKRS